MTCGELPLAVARTLPVGNLGTAAERGQMVLPVAQRACVTVVDFDQVEQRLRMVALQPVGQGMAKRAEARVAAIAKCQHTIAKLAQRIVAATGEQPARKARGAVGRIAFARRADHEQRLPEVGQPARIEIGEGQQLHGHAGTLQCRGGLHGQLLGEAVWLA